MCILMSDELLARMQVGCALYADDDYKQLLVRTRKCPRCQRHYHRTDHRHWTAGGAAPDSIDCRRRLLPSVSSNFKKNKRNAIVTDPVPTAD